MNFLKIFVPTFLIVGLINQSFYGFCMKSYCLSAAFPKVAIISAIIAFGIYKIKEREG